MIYKHQYFTLNTETQEVFNKYGEDIKLTGYPFHLLKYLCVRKGGKVHISDIELIFDVTGNKMLNHNNIRQYLNTIKNKLNRSIVNYDHEYYSINGPVTETDNSDLTQPEQSVNKKILVAEDPKKAEPKDKKKNKKIKWILIGVGILILLAIITVASFFAYKSIKAKNFPRPQSEMILIPAGEFIMGSTEAQIEDAFKSCEEGNYCQIEDYQGEFPQHTVYVKDFYIDKKEVSNANYELFVKATNRETPEFIDEPSANAPQQPIVGVDYLDALAYCKWVGGRLPTEEEWEKAARGTDGRLFAWGNVWDPKMANHGKGGVKANDDTDGFYDSAPVGTDTDVSPYGVLNMTGNVGEWTSTIYAPYPGNDKFIDTDSKVPYRVLRGGDFLYGVSECRLTTRWTSEDDSKGVSTGFRCAKDK